MSLPVRKTAPRIKHVINIKIIKSRALKKVLGRMTWCSVLLSWGIARVDLMEKAILTEMPLACTGAVDFEPLVHAHARFVFKIAYAALRHTEDAEDVVQETFLRAIRSGKAGRVEHMRSWLARIAWRLALDRLRHRACRNNRELASDLAATLPASGPGAEETLLQVEKLTLLEQLLKGMPRSLRNALILFTVEGMTSEEVGRVLGISTSSVRNRVNRARNYLKEKLASLMESTHGS
jgi:RNA polymerase sigma-70 factor (ECF subfamily)